MKKLIAFLLIVILSFSLFAYEIETSRGVIELDVPNGLTLEEAYCEMAKMYLEERWEHEALIDKAEVLSTKVESYLEENRTLKEEYEKTISLYREEVKSYEELSSLYEELLAKRNKNFYPYVALSYNQNFNGTSFNVRADFGMVVFSKFILLSSLSNDSLGIGLGYVF